MYFTLRPSLVDAYTSMIHFARYLTDSLRGPVNKPYDKARRAQRGAERRVGVGNETGGFKNTDGERPF